MRRYLAIIAATVLLLMTSAASASASTAYITPHMTPPLKGCRWEWPASLWRFRYYGCYCPRGMHVVYPRFIGEPYCAKGPPPPRPPLWPSKPPIVTGR